MKHIIKNYILVMIFVPFPVDGLLVENFVLFKIMSQRNFILSFNSKDFALTSQFKMYGQISSSISQDLIFKEDHKYVVQSKVSNEVFQQFLQYLIDKTEPEIQFDTIYELKQLSDEFEIKELKELIEKKKQKWLEMEKFFEEQSTSAHTSTVTTTQEDPAIKQQLVQFYQIFESRIDNLSNEIQKFKVKLSSQNDELLKQIENQIQDSVNQQNEKIAEENQKIENEMNLKLQQIEDVIKSNEEKTDLQNSSNIELQNGIEQLKNQPELINNKLVKQNEDIVNFEENINLQLEQIKQTIDKQQQELENKLKTQLQNYITKEI